MMNKHLLIKIFLTLFLASTSFYGSLAQESSNQLERISELKDAVPIRLNRPKYPVSELSKRKEGWALVSFIIDEEGNAKNIMIEDSVGGKGFETASKKAVNRFRFEPALKNGEPISQSMIRFMFSFVINNMGNGARRKFINEYTKIMALIESNDEDVNDEINYLMVGLKYSNVNNLYENAWYGWLEASYLYKYDRSNNEAIIESLKTATMLKRNNSTTRPKTGSRIVDLTKIEQIYLADDYFVLASKMLFMQYLQQNELSLALRTYEVLTNAEQLKGSSTYEEAVASLSPLYDQVIERIDGDSTLLQTGLIGSNDYWVHELLRPSFSIENVEGSLSTIDIRCSGRNAEYAFIANQVWAIPKSWGLCSLYLKGEEGARFDFYSIP